MKNVQAYKTIGEVEKILKVKPHVLRFWEESFSQVNPIKRKGGRRLYSEDLINVLRTIKKLVNEISLSNKILKTIKSRGFITLPTDLLIFESLLSHQPCAKIVFGRSKPIDISIVGQ